MSQGTEVAQLFRSPEDCRFEHQGTDAWRARDLMPLLGYDKWERFRGAIQRAWESCAAAGIDTSVNFLVGAGTKAWSAEEVFPGREKPARRSPQRGVLYEHDVDGPGIARIRSKGDALLFGGNDPEAMKAKWNVPAKRPVADFAPEVVVVGKQFATAITTHNVKTNKLKGEVAITHEHLANNKTVRETLAERGIVPEQLAPEEDIKKVERRHGAESRKLAKPRSAKKT